MGISALSYFSIPYNVPGTELWNFFYKKPFPFPLQKRPYVYSIKKYPDKIEFEVYFYRYYIYRNVPNVILDNRVTTEDAKTFHSIYNTFSIPSNYIITSMDIDSNCEILTDHINFYYEVNHYYTCEEYSIKNNTNILQNIYDIDYKVLPYEGHHHKFIINYKLPDTIVFIANKIQKKHICYYFENVKWYIFLKFLEDFNYSEDFIQFCKDTYNDSYRFCFSYDIDADTETIQKSTIFSVYYHGGEYQES